MVAGEGRRIFHKEQRVGTFAKGMVRKSRAGEDGAVSLRAREWEKGLTVRGGDL